MKHRAIKFQDVEADMRDVVNTLIRRERGLLGGDLDPYFHDVHDHLLRTVEMIESYRDLVAATLDFYLAAAANRTNEVMKLLTIWGTVSLPLVIITGFFGMNLPLSLGKPPGQHYLCRWLDAGIYCASAAVFETQGLVLNGG